MLSMKKFVTAMFAIAVLLSTMATFASAQATEEQAQEQVQRLDDHFASKAVVQQQSFAITQSAAAKAKIIITGGPSGTVVNQAYAATFPNQAQPLLLSLEGGVGTCRLHNTYTGETWSNVTMPRAFAPTLDESGETLLIGGYITADCGNGAQTASLFVHLFNRFGMMAVSEGDTTSGATGSSKRFYAVSFVASRKFTWTAPGGSPSSGVSDEIFNVSFPTGGVRDIETTFGPAPDRGGHKFSTRLAFYAIGSSALSFSRDRTGITLTASEEADVMAGILTLQVRYARSIQTFNLNVPGVTAGEKLRVDLPNNAEAATIVATYTTDEESPCTWARKLPAMQRPSMPER